MSQDNLLVALGGGPSPVINASLAGLLDRCRDYPGRIGRRLAARHGVEGILLEQLIDLDAEDPAELARLRDTPASGAVGTCRYKLGADREEDYERIVAILEAHRIGWFFYIGGNDSMDTADKVAALAARRGLNLVVTGVPKTIDNDVGDEARTLIDHTPGYGSTARWWATVMRTAEEENRGMAGSECVSVWQAMGRKSGFIAAAARLADPERRWPMQIYFAESGHNLETLTDKVNEQLRRSGRCIVIVNEGLDVGDIGAARDGFGHIEYGASRISAAQAVVNHLNEGRLAVRGNATCQIPGVEQRSTGIYRSVVDIEEAYRVGAHAVDVAVSRGGGRMATILRKPGPVYKTRYADVALGDVANAARFLPRSWISADGIDVTDEFIAYAQPLIGDRWPDAPLQDGLPRYARLRGETLPALLPAYTPVGWR